MDALTFPPAAPAMAAASGRPPCRCGGGSRTDAVLVALIVLIAVILAYCAATGICAGREKFASRRAHEVYQASSALFGKTGGAATYSDFKSADRAADPVLYTDVRNLWRKGALTPETVQTVL